MVGAVVGAIRECYWPMQCAEKFSLWQATSCQAEAQASNAQAPTRRRERVGAWIHCEQQINNVKR